MKPTLEPLAMAYLERDLSEAGARRLACELKANRAELEEFLALSRLHRMLEILFSPEDLATAVLAELKASEDADRFARRVVKHLPHRRRCVRRDRSAWLIVAAAAACAAIVAFFFAHQAGTPVVPPLKPVVNQPPPPRTTELAPKPAEVALVILSGSLSEQVNDRWSPLKHTHVPERTPLRAEGTARVEFAGALVSLDRARFTLTGPTLVLQEGALSAELGTPFELKLGDLCVARASTGRVLICAKPNRVVVDEGVARVGVERLYEGQEYAIEGAALKPVYRTLPPAARPHEVVTWSLDLAKPASFRSKITEGEIVKTERGNVLRSVVVTPKALWGCRIGYWAGSEDVVTYTVKRTTAVRFRYRLKEAMPIRFQIKNLTKQEQFVLDMDGVAGHWTTVTVPALDIPVVTEGKSVMCEVGDRYGRFGFYVTDGELMIDDVCVIEISEPQR